MIIPRILLAAMFAIALTARGEDPAPPGRDWPQFLGPTRDGAYAGADLAGAWPAGGPKTLWQMKIGAGWSGPVVSAGKLICFHRVADKETVQCLDAATGKPIWKADYDSTYQDDFGFDPGPRSTPAIDGDRCYTFGAEGMLSCWAMADGKRLWNVDTRKDLDAGKGFFGIVCSPLIEGDAVILNVGGKNAGIAAFDKTGGKLLWQATADEAGYSSPIAATINGKRYVLSLTRAGLVALDPRSGKAFFEHPFRSRNNASVNAATPVVIDDQIFLTASYGTGAALLKFDEATPKVLWANDASLSSHYATPIHHDGHLYGFDGRQEQGCNLRCIELTTGKVKWNEAQFGAGSMMRMGDDLLILHENGELIRAAATPAGFTVKDRAQILGHDTRAYPALTAGLYFARDKNNLVCIDLRKN
ncbi:MAG: outer rane biosis protein BamB [Phycisphaerales bacterium]|nr:outer rane biosis protein BamB [Phycisphaerales bacterium]